MLQMVNARLWEGTRNRLRVDEHVTCMLLRATRAGDVEYAGAHETVLVLRDAGPCERIQSTGTWLSVARDVSTANTDRTLSLVPGDLLVLHSDGVIEARTPDGEPFGIDRLATLVESGRALPIAQLRDDVLDQVWQWAPQQVDDVTLVIVRYLG